VTPPPSSIKNNNNNVRVVEAEPVTLPMPSLKMTSTFAFFQQAIPATVIRDVTP